MKIPNFKISSQVGAGFGLVLVMMAALIVFAFVRLTIIDTSNEKIINIDWANTDAVHIINVTTRANANLTMELFMASEKEEAATINARIDANEKIVSQALEALDKSIQTAERRPFLEQIMKTRAKYAESMSEVGILLGQNRRSEATKLMRNETLPALNALQDAIATFSDLQKRSSPPAASRSRKISNRRACRSRC